MRAEGDCAHLVRATLTSNPDVLVCWAPRPTSELLQAIYRGDAARAEELLASEPELDVFEAAAAGKTDRLRELLDENSSLANAWADDGYQPLGLIKQMAKHRSVGCAPRSCW